MDALRKAAALAALLALAALPARAEEAHVRADLLSEAETVQAGRPFWVAVRLRMDPDWHTYWKYPGDSGLPTRVEWTVTDGVEAGPLQWPVPERIEMPPLVNFGYHGEVWLLSRFEPRGDLAASTVAVTAKVKWMECADICVPGGADLRLDLPVAAAFRSDARLQEGFSAALKRLPSRGAGWTLSAAKKDSRLTFTAAPPKGAEGAPRFFPASAELARYLGEPAISRKKGVWHLEFVTPPRPGPEVLEGVLVLEDRRTTAALDVRIPVKGGEKIRVEDTP